MPGVARPYTSRTRTLIADETARGTIVPVLLDEGATGRGEGAFRRDFSLRLLLLFLDR